MASSQLRVGFGSKPYGLIAKTGKFYYSGVPQTLRSSVDASLPSVPTGLSATSPSQTEIDLSWAASTSTSGTVVGYNVYRDGTLLGQVASLTYADTGLAVYSLHSYQIASVDNSGRTSALCPAVSARTLDQTAPSVPAGLAANPTAETEIDLTWTASTDIGSGVSAYNIWRDGTQINQSTTPRYNDTSVAAYSLHSYQVSAQDAAGNISALCPAVSARSLDLTPPTVPAGLTATVISSSEIDLSWSASTDSASGVASYNVWRNGTRVHNQTTRTYADTGLSAGTTYQYQVSAVDLSGNESAACAIVSGTTSGTGTGLAGPTNMWPSYIDTTSYSFMWWYPPSQTAGANAVFTAGITGGTQLNVTTLTSGGPSIGQVISSTSPGTSIPSGTSIIGYVSGVSGGANSSYTVSNTCTIPAGSTINAFANPASYYKLYRDGTLVDLTPGAAVWGGVTPLNPGITACPIGFALNPQPFYTERGLTPGESHTYQVSAMFGTTETLKGPALTMTTVSGPPATGAALPAAVINPGTWIASSAPLPTGTTWTCTNTTTNAVSGGGTLGNSGCSIGWVLGFDQGNVPRCNIHGNDIIVLTAGARYPTPGAGGYQWPAFDGNAGWTLITNSEDPRIKPGGKLIPYAYSTNPIGPVPITVTGAPAYSATSATLSPSQAGYTDSAGRWLLKSGWYYVYFDESPVLFADGTPYEERCVTFTQGSSTIDWSLHNENYQNNTVTAVGTYTAGSGYSSYVSVGLSGGTGSGAKASLIASSGGVITSVSAITAAGAGYVVGDVLGETTLAGTGMQLTVAAVSAGAITSLTVTAGGTGYTNGGVYLGAVETSGTGTDANFNVTVAGGVVTSFTLNYGGTGYAVGNTLSVPVSAIGGTGSGPITVPVTTIRAVGAGLANAASATILPTYLPGVTPWDYYQNSALAMIDVGSVINGTGVQFPSSCTKVWMTGIYVHVGPTPTTSTKTATNCILFQKGVGTTYTAPSQDIVIDRCISGTIPGASDFGFCSHNIAGINTNHLLVHQSWVSGSASNPAVNSGQDANTYGTNGSGHCYQNSYLSSTSENIIYGGIINPQLPQGSDIVIRYCMSHKPLDWFQGAADGTSNAGSGPYKQWGLNLKNNIEFKQGVRVEIYGNYFLGSCSANQTGYHGAMIALGARCGYQDPFHPVTDIHIHDNLMYRCACPLVSFTNDNGIGSYDARVWMHNNLIWMAPYLSNNDRTYGFRLYGPCTDHIIENNTMITNQYAPQKQGAPMGSYFIVVNNGAGGQFGGGNTYTPGTGWTKTMDRMVFRDNIIDSGGNGWAFHSDSTLPAPWLYPNAIFNKNITTSWDANTYSGSGTYNSIPYASIGFAAFVDSNRMPLTPHDWVITSGPYVTGSTKGGPVGYLGQVSQDPITQKWWAPNSPFNVPIPAGTFSTPMDSGQAIAAYIAASLTPDVAFFPQSTSWTACLIVAPAGTPTIRWSFNYNGTWNFPAIPAGGSVGTQIANAASWFAGQGDTDRSINLYSEDTGMMYDIYPDNNTTNGNGPIKITTASVRPLSGSGWWNQCNFATLSSGTASGCCQVGGSIKPSEWAAGVIPHALCGAYPANYAGYNPSSPDMTGAGAGNYCAFVWPARGSDGFAGSGSVSANWLPEGARLQLDPSLTDANLTALGVPSAMLPVCHALQTYGWYSLDMSGTLNPAQIKFLSTNPNATSGFNGPYSGAANLPIALMSHMAWIPGPWIGGAAALGTGVTVTGTSGQCSYTTNFGSGDGLVHVGDLVQVYPTYNYGGNRGTGGLQGFSPPGARNTAAWWNPVAYKVTAVGSGTFTLGDSNGVAITSTAGTMNCYFSTCAPIDSVASMTALGALGSGP